MSGAYPRYTPGASNPDAAWALFNGSTVEGAAPFDPSGYAPTSSYDSSTGTFTFIPTNTATQVDGYREACPRFSIPLADLYPDFDSNSDLLELALTLTQPAKNDAWGVAVGLFDQPSSGYATSDGYAFGTGTHATNPGWSYELPIDSTAPAAYVNVANETSAFRILWQRETNAARAAVWWRNSATGLWQGTNLMDTYLNTTSVGTPLYIHVMFMHLNTTPATAQTWPCKLYHRLFRGASAELP